jgi:hypothetical protein
MGVWERSVSGIWTIPKFEKQRKQRKQKGVVALNGVHVVARDTIIRVVAGVTLNPIVRVLYLDEVKNTWYSKE